MTPAKLTKKQHDFIRSSLIAGRSEAIQGRKYVNTKVGIVGIVDVKSLYPSVTGCTDDERKTLGFEVFYPCGQAIEVTK